MTRLLVATLWTVSALALAGCRSEANEPSPPAPASQAPPVTTRLPAPTPAAAPTAAALAEGASATTTAPPEGRLVLLFTGDNGGEVAPCG